MAEMATQTEYAEFERGAGIVCVERGALVLMFQML